MLEPPPPTGAKGKVDKDLRLRCMIKLGEVGIMPELLFYF